MTKQNYKIAIIGLGYVGLPLAVEFGKIYSTVGYDINEKRINELKMSIDSTNEVDKVTLTNVINNGLFKVSAISEDISNSNTYIITVPTPIDKNNNPDLNPIISATKLVASFLKKDDIVIYESTVYPGVTEDVCVPILEQISNLIYNHEFFVGYSPERINPGDKLHTLTNILKITSGSNHFSSEIIDNLYKSIIKAGTFKAKSIKIAEAAKVIENTQRDINIAFVNELSKIFYLLGIDTLEVLEAASTKWNFINFKPGLVGGHCIGVDPYYLAQKAQEIGFYPEIILAGRRINDNMGVYIATRFIKLMIKKSINIKSSNVLVLGFTFKENCPDIRNTKVVDIVNELHTYDLNVTIYDPYASISHVKSEYNLSINNTIPVNTKYDALILAVAHDTFLDLNILNYMNDLHVIFDVKGFLNKNLIDDRL